MVPYGPMVTSYSFTVPFSQFQVTPGLFTILSGNLT